MAGGWKLMRPHKRGSDLFGRQLVQLYNNASESHAFFSSEHFGMSEADRRETRIFHDYHVRTTFVVIVAFIFWTAALLLLGSSNDSGIQPRTEEWVMSLFGVDVWEGVYYCEGIVEEWPHRASK